MARTTLVIINRVDGKTTEGVETLSLDVYPIYRDYKIGAKSVQAKSVMVFTVWI